MPLTLWRASKNGPDMPQKRYGLLGKPFMQNFERYNSIKALWLHRSQFGLVHRKSGAKFKPAICDILACLHPRWHGRAGTPETIKYVHRASVWREAYENKQTSAHCAQCRGVCCCSSPSLDLQHALPLNYSIISLSATTMNGTFCQV